LRFHPIINKILTKYSQKVHRGGVLRVPERGGELKMILDPAIQSFTVNAVREKFNVLPRQMAVNDMSPDENA
jgi:hypothetical protein